MAYAQRHGKKWRVRWRGSDGRWRSRKCPDKKTADKVKRQVEQAHAEGRQWDPDAVREEPTIEGIMRAYLRDCARRLAESSVRRYAGNLDDVLKWLKNRAGKRVGISPLILSKQLLAEMYDDLRAFGRHGHPRSLSTVKKIIEAFERCWIWAHNEDELSEFVPPPKRLQMPVDPEDPVLAPTWMEMDACVAAAGGWIRQLAIMVRFTGLRVQQAMHLRWEDFDLGNSILTIRGELGKSRHEKKGRIIPVSRYLMAEMRRWGPGEYGYVIPCGRKQDGPRAREARGRDMGRAWERAGVREEKWKGRPHHAFRRGMRSELAKAGADWNAVEHLHGHKVGGDVSSRYMDPGFLPLRQAVDLIPPLGQHLQVVKNEKEVG